LREAISKDAELKERWEEDLRLLALLRGLPDAPLSSNFTARVVAQAEHELAADSRRPATVRSWLDSFGLPRLAVKLSGMALILGLSSIGYWRHLEVNRSTLASSVVTISQGVQATAIPSVDLLLEFDQIAQLDNSMVWVDEELLEVLQ